MFNPQVFVVRFFIGFILGVITVQAAQVAFANDWMEQQMFPAFHDMPPAPLLEFDTPPPTTFGSYPYPDIDPYDGYNWDTGNYHDVEIIQQLQDEIEIYNWDTHEYQWVLP